MSQGSADCSGSRRRWASGRSTSPRPAPELIEALLTRVSLTRLAGPRAARIACSGRPAWPGCRACHGHPAAGPGHPPRDVSATQPLHLRVPRPRAASRTIRAFVPAGVIQPRLPATAGQARWLTLGASRISRDCVVNYSLTDPAAFICPRSWDCARPCVNISALPLQGYTLQGHGLKFSRLTVRYPEKSAFRASARGLTPPPGPPRRPTHRAGPARCRRRCPRPTGESPPPPGRGAPGPSHGRGPPPARRRWCR
jgi:hypothetical protein